MEAKDDIYNQISLAAVATAILEPPFVGGKSTYTSANIHCLDAMSVLLFDRLDEIVRVGKSIRSEMKSKHRSISTTQQQPQSRTIKCYFDASADGLLNITIISITDNLFIEDRKWFSLDSGSNDYDLWVLLLSKKRKTDNETVICDTDSNKENCPNRDNNTNIQEDSEDDQENTTKEMNTNKKEPLTISDTMLVTEMLVHSILPKLMSERLLSMKRKSLEFTIPSFVSDKNDSGISDSESHHYPLWSSSSSASSHSSSSTSSSSQSSSISSSTLSTSTIPPILIFLDGDYHKLDQLEWRTKSRRCLERQRILHWT